MNYFVRYPALIPQRAGRASQTYWATFNRPAEGGTEVMPTESFPRLRRQARACSAEGKTAEAAENTRRKQQELTEGTAFIEERTLF
jgi:hypothetical protein